jgi:hypothetical protein
MKKYFLLVFVLVVGLVLTACSGATGNENQVTPTQPPPTITPSPTPLPPTAMPAATPPPTGASLAGVALWGQEPVPGARLELRAVDWRLTGDETAAATATTGAAGQFLFANPPVGEFSLVAIWPDGELSLGGTPAVTIEEGQTLPDQTIRLERGLTLVEPDLTLPVTTLPVFSWESLDGISAYRVLLIDSGTTEAVVETEVTTNSLAVADQLQPSREYTLVISALNADGSESLANLQAGFVTQDTPSVPPPIALPSTCVQPGLPTYIDRQAGYCFAFPQKFGVGDIGNGAGNVAGSPVDRSPEPLFATLAIDEVDSNGRELAEFVDEYLSQYSDTDFDIQRLPTALGGVEAELLEPVPGRLSSRQVIAATGSDTVDILSFAPSFREMAPGTMVTPQRRAQIDADLLFEAVMASFAFIAAGDDPPDEAVEVPDACLAETKGVFIDNDLGYCFNIPVGFSQQTGPGGGPMLVGPALDQSLSPVRALFSLMIEELADGRTLVEVIDEVAGDDSDRSEITLGGEPAIRIEGIPSQGSTLDIFLERDGYAYHLIFQPDSERAPQAAEELDKLIEGITQSFTFLESTPID